MCLIVFAYKHHPQFDLILAANRDEAYARPTRAAQFWDDYPDILAGKDLQAGGTWMGVNRRGHWAALTNYRDPSIDKKDPPSRGKIVLNYLKKETNPQSYLKKLNARPDAYNGFNLMAGDSHKIFHYSNQERKINLVKPGVHGLSNHLLDTPWPKVERSKSALNGLITDQKISCETLFNILQNDRAAEDQQLPDTGISKKLEKKVSSVFIKTGDYGTRCSTVLLIDKQGNVTFEERRFVPGTMEVDETNRFEFEIDRT